MSFFFFFWLWAIRRVTDNDGTQVVGKHEFLGVKHPSLSGMGPSLDLTWHIWTYDPVGALPPKKAPSSESVLSRVSTTKRICRKVCRQFMAIKTLRTWISGPLHPTYQQEIVNISWGNCSRVGSPWTNLESLRPRGEPQKQRLQGGRFEAWSTITRKILPNIAAWHPLTSHWEIGSDGFHPSHSPRRICFERADITEMSVIAAVKQGGAGAIGALQVDFHGVSQMIFLGGRPLVFCSSHI